MVDKEMIRLFKVYMSESAPKAVSDVLMSGYVGEGAKVEAFEQELAEFIGNPNVLCVNSGTSALVLGLICAGVTPGDVVISTPMTCLATNTAILSIGAQIVWADVDPITGLMTFETIDDAMAECRRLSVEPAAIMCMHWGGLPCDLLAINSFGPPVIEDACQALGSAYDGTMIGNHSFATCFSFQAIKTLTTCDGGAIVFDDIIPLERARLMKWFGLNRKLSSDMRCNQDPTELGYKMQMNDVAAAIGLENIKVLRRNLARMQEIYDLYKACLYGHQDVALIEPKGISSNWLCTVLVDGPADFIAYMRNLGIECSKVHDRNDTKLIFEPFTRSLPGVKYFNHHHVCIPCGWWMTNDDVERVIQALKEYKNG